VPLTGRHALTALGERVGVCVPAYQLDPVPGYEEIAVQPGLGAAEFQLHIENYISQLIEALLLVAPLRKMSFEQPKEFLAVIVFLQVT